jgi:hypothetical protein
MNDCRWIHPGGRIVRRDGINEAASEIRKHFEYRYTSIGEIQNNAQRGDMSMGKRHAGSAVPLHRNRLR